MRAGKLHNGVRGSGAVTTDVYEVWCLCGEKVRVTGKTAKCHKCGREIELESWQVKHTMTAAGVLLKAES